MTPSKHEAITPSFVAEVCERLQNEQPIKRPLPGGGFVSIDRELPFLCVYRRDPQRHDPGIRTFANHEAAYLSAPGEAVVRKGLSSLVYQIARQAAARYGAFLILELRGAPDAEVALTVDAKTGERTSPPPAFRVFVETETACNETVDTLRFGLEKIRLFREKAQVTVESNARAHPFGLRRLMTRRQSREMPCYFLGLEILPVFRDPQSEEVFPEVLEELRRKVSKVLKKAFFTFATRNTNLRPHHYYALGRRRIARSVWAIDKQLSSVSTKFDLLLLVTPVNAKSSWEAFRQSDYQKPPVFRYRPLPFDPLVMKRELMSIAVDRVDDPTMAHILRSTQMELDRQLTMLIDLGTERFRLGSLQIHGRVERPLLEHALSILEQSTSDSATSSETTLGPVAFARKAEQQLERYRKIDPSFSATVELREDIYSGLLVSGTRLLVGRDTAVPQHRVKALLAHEVGTHLVTRHNGQMQPMQLLQSGLAGYDPLQEGLAVLAEYLVDGLSLSRLRLLAARVVAVRAMVDGADFVDVFRQLTGACGFSPQTAYTITLRVFRGGGLSKDAAYLRGLNQVLAFLNAGGDIAPLFVGKLAPEHIPLVRELLHRKVLKPPAMMPLFLTNKAMPAKVRKLRSFSNVVDLAISLRRQDTK